MVKKMLKNQLKNKLKKVGCMVLYLILSIKLSELISKANIAEKIRYVTSGTEATMYA